MGTKKYAREITREYLEKIGVEYVSFDGKEILVNGKKKNQWLTKAGYYIVNLYDTDIRMSIPKEQRTTASGEFAIPVHRLVYAWFKGISSAGKVIDHINNNKTDNTIDNLQEITFSENINKNRERRVIKCDIRKPRMYYEEEWERWNRNYQMAKIAKDPKWQHSARSRRAQAEAKLRYWDQEIKKIVNEYTDYVKGDK